MPLPDGLPASQPGAPAFLVELAARVENYLATLLAAEEARWVEVNPTLGVPFSEMRGLVLAGGKRLRPAFCYWGSIATGADPSDERIVRTGAALELLHAFALFHDDIMDGSLTRRGVETTHVDTSREARAMWSELRLELNIGQFLDIVGSARRERRQAEAEQICRYKSGKYTIERPLQLGALVTSAPLPTGVLEQLSAIGLPLGDAFQMRDDILGVFGESSVTGKPAGDDLREGKPTPLLALTTELATPAQVEVLNKVGRPGISASDIADIQEVIQQTGALQTMEDRITQLTAESVSHLSGLSLGNEAIEQFKALAHLVSWRNL